MKPACKSLQIYLVKIVTGLLKILFRFTVLLIVTNMFSLFTLNDDIHSLLLDLIKLVATAVIKCIDKQLVDFLPGGKFHDVSNENDVRRTNLLIQQTLHVSIILMTLTAAKKEDRVHQCIIIPRYSC